MQLESLSAAISTIREDLYIKYPFLSDWKIELDSAKRRAGACHVKNKTVSISEWHILHNDENVVVDTILHEFAHAIAYELHKDISHGPRWKSIAKLIGATPKSTGRFNLPDSPWMLVSVCKETKTLEKIAPRYRRNKKIRNYFMKGRPSTKGKLYYLSMNEYEGFSLNDLKFEQLNFIR